MKNFLKFLSNIYIYTSKPKTKLINKKGFTLVELIIVITILALLGTIAFMSYKGYTKSARNTVRVSTIGEIEKGLELFKAVSSNYPDPDESITFSGGNINNPITIKQGIVGDNMSNVLKLNSIPLDPLTGEKYVYSVFGNNRYYQIASEKEEVSYNNMSDTAYADSKTAIVRGNYKMDPSLPSLVMVKNDALTNSGIFSPKVCFVVDGGVNTVNNCVETKEDMKLNTTDNSLVGYWDMESICNETNCGENINSGKLKDLSGNGNHGTGSGGIVIGGTGGKIGKATVFEPNLKQYFQIANSPSLNVDKNFTMSAIYTYAFSYTGAGSNPILNKPFTSHTSPYYQYNFGVYSPNYDACYTRNTCCGFTILNQITLGENSYSYGKDCFNNKDTIFIISTYDGKNLKNYMNGKLVSNLKLELASIQKYNTDLYIGAYGNLLYLNNNNFYLPGIIDEIKIYNRTLSDEEIAHQARIAGF